MKINRLATLFACLLLCLALVSPSYAGCPDGQFPCTCNGAESCQSSIGGCWNSCIALAKTQPFASPLFTPFDLTDRSEIWQDALQRFAENHPEVSPFEAEAILNAMDLAPEHFTLNPTRENKLAILTALQGLRDTMSLDHYSEVLAGMTELAGWFSTEGFLGDPLRPAPATCNCGDEDLDDCSANYSCQYTLCRSEAGSNSYGTCESTLPTF